MSKFINYNSAECQILKQTFEKMPMMDTYIANIVEEYIYSNVRESNDEGYVSEYRTKYGEKDGEYKMWFPNGTLSAQTTYKDGEINGDYTEWYDHGQIAIKTTYINGKIHGEYKEWYCSEDTGNKIVPWVKTQYKHGKKDGEHKVWFTNGKISSQTTYKDDVRIKSAKK